MSYLSPPQAHDILCGCTARNIFLLALAIHTYTPWLRLCRPPPWLVTTTKIFATSLLAPLSLAPGSNCLPPPPDTPRAATGYDDPSTVRLHLRFRNSDDIRYRFSRRRTRHRTDSTKSSSQLSLVSRGTCLITWEYAL
jgi:hypothetical protein